MRHRVPHENPVLMREWRRFRRYWWGWALLAVAGWVPLMYFVREQSTPLGFPMVWWQQLLLIALGTVLRPDVLLGFFLVYRAANEKNWTSMRGDLAATLLSPRQIVLGKAFVPVLVLFVLNAGAGLYYYGQLLFDPLTQLPVTRPGSGAAQVVSVTESGDGLVVTTEEEFKAILGFLDDGGTTFTFPAAPGAGATPPWRRTAPAAQDVILIPMAIPVAIFALAEDFFFAVLVVLIAMREYLFRQNALTATFLGLGRVMLAGLPIVGCYFAPLLVTMWLPLDWQTRLMFSPPLDFLFSNAIWFALVLPVEFLLIRWVYSGIRAKMNEWLAEEI